MCICLWSLNYLSVLCVCFCTLKRKPKSLSLCGKWQARERDKVGESFSTQKTKRVITWEKREPLRLGREPFSSGPLELVAWFVPIIVSLPFTMFLSGFFLFFLCFWEGPCLSFECGWLDCLKILGFEIGSDVGVGFFMLGSLVLWIKNWFFLCGDRWSGLWGGWNLY